MAFIFRINHIFSLMLKILRIYFISWTIIIPFRKKSIKIWALYRFLIFAPLLTFIHFQESSATFVKICNQANSVHRLISSELYLSLSVTSHTNCIVARCLINVVYLTACCLYQVMMTLHFLSDVANDAQSTQKSKITS